MYLIFFLSCSNLTLLAVRTNRRCVPFDYLLDFSSGVVLLELVLGKRLTDGVTSDYFLECSGRSVNHTVEAHAINNLFRLVCMVRIGYGYRC